MATLDLVVKNVRAVRHNHSSIDTVDIGVKDGKFARIEANIPATEASEQFDGKGLLAFPGVVDPHSHPGIYVHVQKDALTESQAAAAGGVTALLDYFRSGSLYLNKGGSYKNFMPELLELSKDHWYIDYGYNISPIEGQHVSEIEYLITEAGVTTIKIFMFYGLHGLHGGSDSQSQWLMLNPGDHYDLAHFEFIMREVARVQAKYPELAPYINVSLHCEVPDLLRAYEHLVQNRTDVSGLKAYSEARPPHNEALAIAIAGDLARLTGCKNINILHITSQEALDAAVRIKAFYPHLNIGLEVTPAHLLLDYDRPVGLYGKTNPPLRSPEDREYLWQRLIDGTVMWLGSDHANCPKGMKEDSFDPTNIWKAKAGFGGVDLSLPGIVTQANRRGVPLQRIAELMAWAPSRRYGVLSKGAIDLGYDADLALVDPNDKWVVDATKSFSTQGFSPAEGMEMDAKVKSTFLRGNLIFNNGEMVGSPKGQYLKRPVAGPNGLKG